MLEIIGLSKQFDSQPALRGVDLAVAAAEVVALLGASGSGKTTLLRIIAGLEQADAGQLLLDGRALDQIPVHRRQFGLVFQDYALFPHKNVRDNVAFGLRMAGWPAEKIAARVTAVLQLVRLEGFEEREVYNLSGGEQQRVALARSLAPAPRLLLLDEPLGSLDRALRERLTLDLRRVLRGDNGDEALAAMTAIYVTHDQGEAFAVADRVVLLRDGLVEQIGRPVELYRRPATPYVARFLGMENLLGGEVVALEPLTIGTPFGRWRATADTPLQIAQQVTVLVRPGAARFWPAGGVAPDAAAANGPNQLAAVLGDLSFRGRYQIARFVVDGTRFQFEFESDLDMPAPGTAVTLTLDPAGVVVLASGEDSRLGLLPQSAEAYNI
jgi:ABC-type Fe3+/spermidine/putrescine transport system ATPase subunit